MHEQQGPRMTRFRRSFQLRNTSPSANRTRLIYRRSDHPSTSAPGGTSSTAAQDREHGRSDTKTSCRPRQLSLLPGSDGACLLSHTEDGLGNGFGSRGCRAMGQEDMVS